MGIGAISCIGADCMWHDTCDDSIAGALCPHPLIAESESSSGAWVPCSSGWVLDTTGLTDRKIEFELSKMKDLLEGTSLSVSEAGVPTVSLTPDIASTLELPLETEPAWAR